MKYLKEFVCSILLLIGVLSFAPSITEAVHVNGYYRSNGTYVNSYERSSPDSSPYNNYSYPGNYNPNTGRITGGSASSYLDSYNSSPSSYSYPSTPSCPINSYYDGISSCKCNLGYSSDGSSCVSKDSLCHDQLGYSSSYDSLYDKCKCNYGNIIGSGGKCVNANMYCSDQLGVMSEYNSSTNKCECYTGYEYDGSTCVYKKPAYSYPISSQTYVPTTSCPINSHESTSDSASCQCDSGYHINASKDGCLLIPAPVKTNDEQCQDLYGSNSNWDGTKNPNETINCSCKSGYEWNASKTSCLVIQQKIEAEPLPAVVETKDLKVAPKQLVEHVVKVKTVASATKPLLASVSDAIPPAKTPVKKEGWFQSFLNWFK